MTRHPSLVNGHAGDPDHLELRVDVRPVRVRRPPPPALVVARCVYVAVLVALVLGMPPLLRSVGQALG